MIDSAIPQVLQFIAWFCALIELIMGLYVLVLNVRHPANRHVFGFFLVSAANAMGTGILAGATNIQEARPGTWLLSASTGAMQPLLILVAVVLLRPAWLRGRWRWIAWPLYALTFLPILLTIVDVAAETGLYYTGLDPQTYRSGFVSYHVYTAGLLSGLLRVLSTYILGLVPVFLGAYVMIADARAKRLRQSWTGGEARLSQEAEATPLRPSPPLATTMIVMLTPLMPFVSILALSPLLGMVTALLLVNVTYILAYSHAAFQQMISERRAQRGHLQLRLTALVLVITIPIFVGALLIASTRTSRLLQERAARELEMTNRALATHVTTWFDMNVRALTQLVAMPDVSSMDPARQAPALEAMAAAHPDIQLVSTTDWNGINVARSDGADAKDYGDEAWFLDVRAGASYAAHTLISRMSGEPSLIISMPIYNTRGEPVGVCMLWTGLAEISSQVQASQVGRSGFAYLVDGQNNVLAHRDPAYTRAALQDASNWPAVVDLDSESLTPSGEMPAVGVPKQARFADEQGEWLAYVVRLENGWGVVVQQPQSDLRAAQTPLLGILWGVLGVGTAVLASLVWLTVRQALRPVQVLTQAASAVAQGNLEVTADVQSEDELGQLAKTFNGMTDRLRSMIGTLEENVRERTIDLERRSRYFQGTAEIGRTAASMPDTDELLHTVADLICKRFELDYVGLFLTDDTGEWAVLRASAGAAGQQMPVQEGRHKVDPTSMVGRCLMTGKADVPSDDQAADAYSLPQTRSEWALPLVVRDNVIGAMAVTSQERAFFDQAYVAALQMAADQVALALENARLVGETKEALEATRRAASERTQESWAELLQTRGHWGYRYVRGHTAELSGEQIASSGAFTSAGTEMNTLALPLQVRDQVVGMLHFRKDQDQGWTEREVEVLRLLVGQMGDALVGAQLYQSAQANAAREQVVGELATRMRQTLDVESVLRTAVEEVRRALDLPEVVVRLQTPPGA